MDRSSLKFQNQQIEAKFQKSIGNKINSQFLWLIISFIVVGFFCVIIEVVNTNYLAAEVLTGYSALYIGTSLYIFKHPSVALKILKLFSKLNFLLPAISVLFSVFHIIELQTGVALLLMAFIYAPLFNSSYNIIQDAILIFISVCFAIFHISYLIGFSPYFLALTCPIIYLIYQRHIQIKEERTLFSQSLVNQSLVDVITKICKENIIIFTYNLEQHKYEKEIINETAQSYFNTDILGEILKEIHIKNQPIETDISSFVFKNCIQQEKRGEFELKGYYKSKTNKILIHLYVTQYQNIQIILKIEKKQNKGIKINKARKLINFQIYFLENLLRKFRESFSMLGRIDIKQQQIYDYLRKSIIYNKLQILTIAKLSKITTQSINLEQILKDVFTSWNLKFSLITTLQIIKDRNCLTKNQDKKIIYSSKILLEMTLNIAAIILRKIISNPKEYIMIELVYSEEIILINFHFNSKKSQSPIQFLKNSLQNLIAIIGIRGSLETKESILSLQILKQLEEQI